MALGVAEKTKTFQKQKGPGGRAAAHIKKYLFDRRYFLC